MTAQLRYFVNTEKRWCLSGTEFYGRAHIAKVKGNALSLCGVSVDTHYLVRWRDLCKRCQRICEREMIGEPSP